MRIDSRQAAIELFSQGYFGEPIDTWFDFNKWFADSKPNKLYVIRQHVRASGGSGYCKYNLTREEVRADIMRLRNEGFDTSKLFINEAMPDHEALLQGEYMAGPSTLYYSTEAKHMRPALESSGRHAYGPTADLLIRDAMCHEAYDCFLNLKDVYPEATIEFSTYRIPIGTGRWNTVIWEVRNY